MNGINTREAANGKSSEREEPQPSGALAVGGSCNRRLMSNQADEHLVKLVAWKLPSPLILPTLEPVSTG
ncbi:hypothetical protein BaRGS_00001633 [Batillaria attramentaria]|uniref:Uncharacterized protein n=1 Tax=Batillaria attramentaria TaxID=370345 RepID=A0ABD0M7F6_9CAEN